MQQDDKNQTARDIVELFKDGSSTSENYVRDCAALVEQTDGRLNAWQHLDADKAIAEAY